MIFRPLKRVHLLFGTSCEVFASAKERCPPNGGYMTSILLKKRLGPQLGVRLKGVTA